MTAVTVNPRERVRAAWFPTPNLTRDQVECAILGHLLAGAEESTRVIWLLRKDYFQDRGRGFVFEAISDALRHDRDATPVAVVRWLGAEYDIPRQRADRLVEDLRVGVDLCPASDLEYLAHCLAAADLAPVPGRAPRSAMLALIDNWPSDDTSLPEEPVTPMPEAAPEQTSLYRWYDAADRLLYVGITGSLVSRQSSHFKRSSWEAFAVRSTVERFATRAEASAAEVEAITTEHPLFNRQHNDTPEARARLVAYLVEHERFDLLLPAVSRG